MNSEAIAELDQRLAVLDAEIETKTKELRAGAFKAAFSKPAATDRTKLKSEVIALELDRDELRAARAQGLQMIDDMERAGEAAQQLAQRQRRLQARCESNARARQAADDMGKAAEAFIAASKALLAENHGVDATAHEHLSMLPRRVIKGIVSELRAAGVHLTNFDVRDTQDHWEVGLGAVSLFHKAVRDPVAA
jgi:hypothetical protein